MKFGPLEIILIIFVIIAVIIIARIIRPGRIASRQNNTAKSGDITGTSENKSGERPKILARTGIALMAAGVIALIAGIGMLQWVLQNYVISFVLILCGIIIFLISRRKG
jgi:uncharacterized ion transporter superfamily protein YfcC